MMDEKEFRSSYFQRVYQYLRRHISSIPSIRFSFTPGQVEGNHVECLQVLLKYCQLDNATFILVYHSNR